jgi:hypothetical protein
VRREDLLPPCAPLRRAVPGAGALLGLIVAGSASATLGVQCAWPPASGTAQEAGSTDVMMTPIVGDLDGVGGPEIVVVTFEDVNDNNRGEDGVLRILSGADCTELAALVDPGLVTCFGDSAPRSLQERSDPGVFCPGCGAAIADLDDDGDLEIVLLAEGRPRPSDPDDFSFGFPRRIAVFDHDGNFLWCSEASPVWLGHLAAPAVADLDADGEPEIVVRSAVFNSDGSLRWARPPAGYGPSVVADLDGDLRPEVVVGEAAYRADGSLLWERPDLLAGFAAVADLNLDCLPEVVFTATKRAEVHVLDGRTGATLVSAGLPGGVTACSHPRGDQGGAPTLADVDGDLVPEIGVAGCLQYSLFRVTDDGLGNLTGLVELWSSPTSDQSSRVTASTFFDLEGDDSIEVLYQDEERLRVYDASTGGVVDSFDHSNSTLIEYPALADVDADGHAEIVIVGNDYNRCCDVGIKVLYGSDPASPWTPTRTILNQHAYHQTNVGDDGSIPVVEEAHWSRNNNDRAQLVPSAPVRDDCTPPGLLCDFGGPLTASCSVDPACPGGVELLLQAVEDPLGSPLPVEYRWTIDCAGDVQVLDGRVVTACVPVTCQGCALRLAVTTPHRPLSECESTIDWVFDRPPLTIDAGPDATADCSAALDPLPPLVEAACGVAPATLHSRTIEPGPCPGRFTVRDRWFATDDCGDLVEDERVIEVEDTTAPSLDGLPADLTATCDDVPPPPPVTATDDCSGVRLDLEEARLDGDCPDRYLLVRTWTATDECGNSASASRTVAVDDVQAPAISGVPGDETVPCGGLPDPVTPSVSDACDPDPTLVLVETLVPGPCPHSHDVVRTWTATDRCGNASTVGRTIFVRDLEPPVLVAPPPLVLECLDGGSVSADDPRVRDWLESAFATDDCTDPVEVTWEAPPAFPVGCPDPIVTPVRFRAEDECGNAVEATSTVEVVDTTPPLVLATDLPGCLWSPNHMYACIPDVGALVDAVDACSGAVSVRVEGCTSDQPDEAPVEGDRGGRVLGNGDGHHFDDCLVAPDGSGVCARFERQGTDGAGRHYSIAVVVEDGCGNATVVPWDLFVPHDQREHPCPNAKRSTRVGPNDPLPWE